MPEYHLTTLANGLRVVTVEMPHLHCAEMVCYIGTGGRHEEAGVAGISHFLEHMLYRGTKEHPSAHELALAFESFGGSLMATTSSDTGTLEVSVPPAHLKDVMPLFAEVFKAPSFSAIDIERGIVTEEILEGLEGEALESIVTTITHDRVRWIDVMIQEEYGLPLQGPSPFKAGLATFSTFLLIGAVPLLPFLVPYLNGGGYYVASAVMALLALFGVGYVKGIVLVMPRWRAGLETLLMGGAAAGIAFLFGYFLEPLLAGLDIN